MTSFATFLATHQWILILAAIWTIPWKGVALWRAARNRSVSWFVVLLIVNTLGILEIIYIFAFSKKGKEEEPQPIETPEIPTPEKIVLDIKGEEKAEEKTEAKEEEEKKEEEKSSLDEEIPKS
ncbi:MAG TPA: DUF5652 family protein [Candidatus Saccharimonadales bacterium]|nr:DUF5652 family protein [Candidatus Saccharimonadales bacterium]